MNVIPLVIITLQHLHQPKNLLFMFITRVYKIFFFPKGSSGNTETCYWIHCYCRHFYLYPVSENVISIMNQFNFKFR